MSTSPLYPPLAPLSGWLRVRRRGKRTSKRRWAVLSGDELLLYESERAWQTGARVRTCVSLGSLLGVCVEASCAGDHMAVALMGSESFSLVPEEHQELQPWLHRLQTAAGQGDGGGVQPVSGKRQYERMWYVTVSDRGLGSSRRVAGPYWVGLTDDGIQLISRTCNKQQQQQIPATVHEIPFHTIRGCHHMDLFFCMEVGRNSPFGAGELFMVLEERIFAQNMHEVIKSCFSRKSRALTNPGRRNTAISPSAASDRSSPAEERARGLVPADTPKAPLTPDQLDHTAAPIDSYILMAPTGSEPIAIETPSSNSEVCVASPALSEPLAGPSTPLSSSSSAIPEGIRLRASSLGSRLGRGIFRRRPASGSRPGSSPSSSSSPRVGKLSSSLESTLGALFASNRRSRSSLQSQQSVGAGADQVRARSGSYGGRGSSLVAVSPAPLQPVSDESFSNYMVCDGSALASPDADYLNMQPSSDAYMDMGAVTHTQPSSDDDYLLMDIASASSSLPPVQEAVTQLSDYLDMCPGRTIDEEDKQSPLHSTIKSIPPQECNDSAQLPMGSLTLQDRPAKSASSPGVPAEHHVVYAALDLPPGTTGLSGPELDRQNLSSYSEVVFDKTAENSSQS